MTKQKLEMFRGDSQKYTFSVKVNGAAPPGGIAGWTFWMTAKTDLNDPDVDAVFQVLNVDFTIEDPDLAEVSVVILPTKTVDLPITADTTYLFDVQGKETAGAIHTLAFGTLKVRLDATRAAA